MAASATPPGVVDPTRIGKYPIILSDALVGKSPKEILTAMKYNHKPTLSSDTAPSSAKLKPSSSSSTSSYDLSFNDDGAKYAYSGTRSTKENQYALIFDPERKAFVLHRLDSTFNMNVTRTPSNSDPDALKDEYPHLDSSSIRVSTDPNTKAGANNNKKKGPGRAGKGSAAKNAGMVENKRSAAATSSSSTNKAKAKAAEAAQEKKKEEKQRAPRSPNDSEDDDNSDDDDGLLVEYPDPQPGSVHSSFGGGGRPQQQQNDPPIRRFSEFMASQDESDEDADAEYDEDDLVVEDDGAEFKLPSPVGRNGQGQGQNGGAADESGNADAEGEDDDTPEDEELMAMLEEEMGEAGMDVDSESSVSEED